MKIKNRDTSNIEVLGKAFKCSSNFKVRQHISSLILLRTLQGKMWAILIENRHRII